MPSGKTNKRLQISNFKLQSILELTQAINNNVSQKVLLNRLAMTLRYYLNVSKILIYHHRNDWEVVLRSGVRLSLVKQIQVQEDVIPLGDEITQVTFSKKPYLRAFDFVIPIYHKKKPLAYVLIGDEIDATGVTPSIKHLMFIQTLANIIIVAIENKLLYNENLKKEALQRDLALAAEVQYYLIPNNAALPDNHYFYVEGYYRPHFTIGGDYYDFIKLSEEDYLFCLADVSGKGVSAALLMANFQANVRALAHKDMELKTLIIQLNDIVSQLTQNDRFVTFFVARYNVKTRQLKYVNAGNNPPFLYNAQTQTVEHLSLGTVGVGMVAKMPPIKEGTLFIPQESILMAYTDGLVELNNKDDVGVNMNEIEEIIMREKSLKTVLKKVRHKVEKSTNTMQYFDDISILGMQFH